MEYRHGIYLTEEATEIIPPITATTPTVVVGTAPIHLATNPAASNTPQICYTLNEFVEKFGWSDDFDAYTLCEAAQVHFQLFNVSPLICINVLDLSKHFKTVTKEISSSQKLSDGIILSTIKITSGHLPESYSVVGVQSTEPINIPEEISGEFKITSGNALLQVETDYTIGDGKITLTEAGLAKVDGALTFTELENTLVTFAADEDYTAAHDGDGNTNLTIISTGKIVDGKMTLSYQAVDADLVTVSDIVGGVDVNTGQNLGLECVEEVYPKFGMIPGQIIAPKFSCNVTVAAMLKAKAQLINGVFKAMAIADLPTESARTYGDANSVKTANTLVDGHLVACWPKVALGGVQYFLSTQLAALMCSVDTAHDDLPYKSPSNETLQCNQAILADGTDIFLGKSQANYLNGCGIATALNFGGWRAWGNRTSIYPSSSDPKDSFIACRRMLNFIGNTLALSFFSRVDMPINKRLVEDIIESANIWLNGLMARGAILGGRCVMLAEDNPLTDLVDGILRIRIYVGLIPPARSIEFTLEFDVNYLNNLFA